MTYQLKLEIDSKYLISYCVLSSRILSCEHLILHDGVTIMQALKCEVSQSNFSATIPRVQVLVCSTIQWTTTHIVQFMSFGSKLGPPEISVTYAMTYRRKPSVHIVKFIAVRKKWPMSLLDIFKNLFLRYNWPDFWQKLAFNDALSQL